MVDADELAREVTSTGGAALAQIAARWPNAIRSDGTLDRAALAAIVFDDDAARAALNAIVHPLVRQAGAEREARAKPGQIVVRDVPLLFEAGFYRSCDANVLVVAPLQVRLERIAWRGGLSEEEARRRIAAQIDPASARNLADYVIENDGTLHALRARTGEVYEALLERARA